jgi:hypothetical protein
VPATPGFLDDVLTTDAHLVDARTVTPGIEPSASTELGALRRVWDAASRIRLYPCF